MDELSSRALTAKADEAVLEAFIQENKAFILGTASRTMKRYVTDSDDEWSVALIAFDEAVKSYEESKGDFRVFAGMVIKRRLIDHIRSESRHNAEISVEPYAMDGDTGDEDETTGLQLEVRSRTAEMAENAGTSGSIRDEIVHLSQLLKEYGISFFELEEASPRAEKTKNACAAAVRTLIGDEDMKAAMIKKKTLPMKELSKTSGVDRKTLERHRKYLIAVALILIEDLPQMAEYVGYIKAGEPQENI
ncbi:MAG: RNA polymerase sigma-I factor [Lachnospiraceae bacterium]|nr:RNA polymerase sigma-I factor [Lachnospiraceae bacterium]